MKYSLGISNFLEEISSLSHSVVFLYFFALRNAGLEETQAGIKIARTNINNLRYADDTTLMAESKEELKSLLMKVKEVSEKADLKLHIQKARILVSSPPTSCIYMPKQWEQWKPLFSWALKSLRTVTEAMKLKDACSLEEKLWQT